MSVSDEEMLVVRSIRQSFESFGGPGSSINATQNPFFISLTGQFDLLKAAQLVLDNVDQHRARKAQMAKDEAARQLKASPAEDEAT